MLLNSPSLLQSIAGRGASRPGAAFLVTGMLGLSPPPLRRCYGVVAKAVTHSQANRRIKDTLDNLYDVDYVAWLEAVAAQVRAGNFTAIDTDHLADEIIAIAQAHQKKAASLARQILLHLLNLDF
ncbi:hypothetical protein WJX72_001526 [[Myrmecia] bisecta]|uniref:Uncharacterized protein n=1 Tax=[Myrmecia] bisecta TaxID=41462 RepID=A0AAW1PWX0_9CHLO